ncbi:hypothetical protein [Lacihabitans lacunae]|uniref:Uncharacterized protein n=1 Tax=Lacihabitans lacunae TaxID=1028214 RepID=A0ABV7Z012_9BACT
MIKKQNHVKTSAPEERYFGKKTEIVNRLALEEQLINKTDTSSKKKQNTVRASFGKKNKTT